MRGLNAIFVPPKNVQRIKNTRSEVSLFKHDSILTKKKKKPKKRETFERVKTRERERSKSIC